MSDWISVNDGLPPIAKTTSYSESKRIIVRVNSDKWGCQNAFGQAIYMPNGDFLYFRVDGFNGEINVTHWQDEPER